MVDPVSLGPAKPVQGRKEKVVEKFATPVFDRGEASVSTPPFSKLVSLVSELSSQAPVDTAKIVLLRNAIDTGNYRADPNIIADAMLSYYGGRI